MSVSNIHNGITAQQTGGPSANQPLQRGAKKTGSTLQKTEGYCSINDAYFEKSKPQEQLAAQQKALTPNKPNPKYNLSQKAPEKTITDFYLSQTGSMPKIKFITKAETEIEVGKSETPDSVIVGQAEVPDEFTVG